MCRIIGIHCYATGTGSRFPIMNATKAKNILLAVILTAASYSTDKQSN